jgi:hypothetical protein
VEVLRTRFDEFARCDVEIRAHYGRETIVRILSDKETEETWEVAEGGSEGVDGGVGPG